MIYIYSPTNVATGGTELLQQLGFKLKQLGISSKMLYSEEYEGSPVQKKFAEYKNEFCYEIQDDSQNLLIVPETAIGLLYKQKKIKKAIWWLSVDNKMAAERNEAGLKVFVKNIFFNMQKNKIKHFVQSEYAKEYLCDKSVKEKNIYMLSDYINHYYIQNALDNKNQIKENNVLYNPKKGIEFTKKIIERSEDKFNWIPLQNFTNEEMCDVMKKSKVYIDFGNHPGKDRIPREAALCGCCIITSKRGSAKNKIDVMIPEEFKFDDSEQNITSIISRIEECLNSYENQVEKFRAYVDRTIKEEEQFEKDVKNIFLN